MSMAHRVALGSTGFADSDWEAPELEARRAANTLSLTSTDGRSAKPYWNFSISLRLPNYSS